MKVLVLLSTYNGERYLREQLNSLIAQEGVETLILVRDDGSADGTVGILREFAAHHPNIDVRVGENLGFSGSFMELARVAAEEYADSVDLFAFSDQDDVWKADKLQRAARVVEFGAQPTLYLSNVIMADERANPIRELSITPPENSTFAYDFVDVGLLGCTFVFNRSLLKLALELRGTKVPPSHDRWFYLVAKIFGKVTVDRDHTMLYRQHNGNVYGSISAAEMPIGVRMRKMWSDRHLLSDHLLPLVPFADRMPKEASECLRLLLQSRGSICGVVRLMLRWRRLGFHRGSALEDVKKVVKLALGFF